MAGEIISSFDTFQKTFPSIKEIDENNPRITALKNYFKLGGVVSAVSQNDAWPKISYPSPFRLMHQINELKKNLEMFSKKKSEWENKFNLAKIYNVKTHAFKFFDKLYWQHLTKSLTDEDYRKDVESVKLPVQMIAEPKYRPMISMFVNDLDYRKQLTETVLTSIVYRKDKRVAKYAQELRNFRLETSNKNIQTLQSKVNELQEQLKNLEIILKWVREK